MKFGIFEIYHQKLIFVIFLTSSQVKKFSQCKLRDKKHQYFSIVSLPTDSVIVDHAVSYVILIISDVHLNFS
jgi:hypothetical protein